MEELLNINVSATNYENSNKEIGNILNMVEEMVHEEESFVMTDSEFAVGWHFYVLSINLILVQKKKDGNIYISADKKGIYRLSFIKFRD